MTSELSATIISFLIGVGQWAQRELSERWKLRREQGVAPIEISEPEQVQQNADAVSGQVMVAADERLIKLQMEVVKKRQELIAMWNFTIVNNQQALLQGLIAPSAVALSEREYKEKIANEKLNIIEDMRKLGLDLVTE